MVSSISSVAFSSSTSSSYSSSSSSSSSSINPRAGYDVFLSFRGEDTRNNFISHLCAALRQKQVKIFIDDEGLERGDEIADVLLTAIVESKISVVIFSKDYASSTWCLDELEKILECKETIGQLVLPVFYHVSPSDVRKQNGSFGKAFVKHEQHFKVQRWRAALTKASNLSGWDASETRPDTKLIDEIVRGILKKLSGLSLSSRNCEYLVGLDSQIEQINSLLCSGLPDIQVVGIWGMGGIGKTTIAGAVYRKISGQFEGCCLVANVKKKLEKNGLARLQLQILFDILREENPDFDTRNDVYSFMRYGLQDKKVLLVLDDVSDLTQLELLIGKLDRFGCGSRIIITSTDKQLLCDYGVDSNFMYEVKGLKDREALQLFCKYAFKENDPLECFMSHSKRIIDYAKGNPLALKMLGSSLYKKSNIREWESTLGILKGFSNLDIYDVLKVGYDMLDEKVQIVFCDIACRFEGEDIDQAVEKLKSCYFFGYFALKTLIDKSLVTISENKLYMHDLLQEIGWKIVSQEPF